MTGLALVILILVLPSIVETVTKHLQKQTELKHKLVLDQIELEKRRHENFQLETEKMKLELQQIKIDEFTKH